MIKKNTQDVINALEAVILDNARQRNVVRMLVKKPNPENLSVGV